MGILYLSLAIVLEVAATTSLKLTTGEHPKWWAWPIVVIGYALAFAALQRCLDAGFPLGIAYAIWCGVGVIAVVVLSAVLFSESLTLVQAIGIVLVIAGVASLELGRPAEPQSSPPAVSVTSTENGLP